MYAIWLVFTDIIHYGTAVQCLTFGVGVYRTHYCLRAVTKSIKKTRTTDKKFAVDVDSVERYGRSQGSR